jgi:heterodisulfide reductase subunit A
MNASEYLPKDEVAIIGGGPAGMQTALALSERGLSVRIYEQKEQLGGHLKGWHHLFPHGVAASDLLGQLKEQVLARAVPLHLGQSVDRLQKVGAGWALWQGERPLGRAGVVVLANGFALFDARRKEEYGYGLYPSVLTAADLEAVFRKEQPWPFGSDRMAPQVGFVHCVGSRDLKCGSPHCSKLCCVTAVKQAMAVKSLFPEAQVYCFYMDLRMHGLEYEELYRKAQVDYGVRFIRGRLSEAAPGQGKRLHVKAEDTLQGRPLHLQLDMLVLMSGMVPAFLLEQQERAVFLKEPVFGSGFVPVQGLLAAGSVVQQEGLFASGACKGPATLPEVFADAAAVAREVEQYLKSLKAVVHA